MSFQEEMSQLRKGDHFIWRHNVNGVLYYSYVVITHVRPDGKIEFEGNCNEGVRDIVLRTNPEAIVGIISDEAYAYARSAGWPNNLEWIEQFIAFTGGLSKLPPL